MREIRTNKEKMRTVEVPTGEHYEEISYETSDREKFVELRDASKHEADLTFKKAEKISFWFPMIDDNWYKAKDEEELKFLIEYLSTNYGGRRYGVGRLKVGEWFTVVAKDRDSLGTADHFVPLSKLKEDYSELLKLLEK